VSLKNIFDTKFVTDKPKFHAVMFVFEYDNKTLTKNAVNITPSVSR